MSTSTELPAREADRRDALAGRLGEATARGLRPVHGLSRRSPRLLSRARRPRSPACAGARRSDRDGSTPGSRMARAAGDQRDPRCRRGRRPRRPPVRPAGRPCRGAPRPDQPDLPGSAEPDGRVGRAHPRPAARHRSGRAPGCPGRRTGPTRGRARRTSTARPATGCSDRPGCRRSTTSMRGSGPTHRPASPTSPAGAAGRRWPSPRLSGDPRSTGSTSTSDRSSSPAPTSPRPGPTSPIGSASTSRMRPTRISRATTTRP